MRENKSKELKKDLEILSQTFERIVDRKDATIKSLAKDLQEADEQYSMALRAHLQSTDNLIGVFLVMSTQHSTHFKLLPSHLLRASYTSICTLHEFKLKFT